MALQGTLDSFSLPDVLRLLADTGKTGRLNVEGDRGRGSVWIREGAVAAAEADRALDGAPVDEVIFELLRFGSGSFAFGADEAPPDGQALGQPADVEEALQRASELLDEWRELETVVPSLNHRVAIAPELTVDKVTVDASRWKTLVAIAAGLSVGELAESLELGELAVSRTVSDLVELGVATVQEPAADAGRRAGAAGANRRSRSERPGRQVKDVPSRQPVRADGNGQRDPARRERTDEPVGAGMNGRRGQARNQDHGADHGADRDNTAPVSLRGAPDDPGANGTGPGGSNGASRGNVQRRSRATGQRANRPLGGGSVPLQTPGERPDAGGGHLGMGRHGGPNGSVEPERHHPGPYGHPSPPPTPTSSGQGLAGLPPFNNNESGPVGHTSLDTGPLGPSPRTGTGQVPVVTASSLPPDLSWAEDDELPGGPPLVAASPPMGTPLVAPPAPASAGVSLSPPMGSALAPAPAGPQSHPRSPGLGTQAPPLADGEIAPHVAVLSPDARLAVEATVGRGGGGSGLVPAAGGTQEEAMQRGALLGFLSSVRG